MVLTSSSSSAGKSPIVRSGSQSEDNIPRDYILPDQLVDITFLIKTLELTYSPKLRLLKVMGAKLRCIPRLQKVISVKEALNFRAATVVGFRLMMWRPCPTFIAVLG